MTSRRHLPLASLLLSGCGLSLPDPTLIQDLRILEIRAEPPETTFIEPGHTANSVAELMGLLQTAPNAAPVRLSAIVAHPDLDATFEYRWERCPPFQSLACDTALVPIHTSTLTATSSVTFSPIAELTHDLEAALAERGPSGAATVVENLANDPRELLDGLFANVILRAGVTHATVPVDTHELQAMKRVVVFDPLLVKLAIMQSRTATRSVAIEGVPSLCSKIPDTELAPIFQYLDTRRPNVPPVYTEVEIDLFPVETATRALAPGEVLHLRPGQAIGLKGHARPEDLEEYRLIDDECQLETLHETLAWSWFTNKGELSRSITSLGTAASNKEGQSLTYRAPRASELTEATTRVRIWSVLRDGRGGSDARVIDLLVER